MPKINFGTGLASLLGGVAAGGAQNLQQEYAQEQRDKEHEKMRQEQFEDAKAERTRQDQEQQLEQQQHIKNWDIGSGLINKYLGVESPDPSATLELSKQGNLLGIDLPSIYNEMAARKESQPYKTDLQGKTIYGKDGLPIKSDWYNQEKAFQKAALPDEYDVRANKHIRRYGKFDPNRNEWMLGADGKPLVTEKQTGEDILEKNNELVEGYGSPIIFTKAVASDFKKKADEINNSWNEAQKRSNDLKTNPVDDMKYGTEANKFYQNRPYASQKDLEADMGRPMTKEEVDKWQSGNTPTDNQLKSIVRKSYSDLGWRKPTRLQRNLDSEIDQVIQGSKPVKNVLNNIYGEIEDNKVIDDKAKSEIFDKAIVDAFDKKEIDTHGVNVLTLKRVATFGTYPPNGIYYNNKKQEFQPVPEEPKTKVETKKSAREISNQKTLKAKKKIPQVGDVVGGYKFKGGDVSKKSNWEKV